MCISEGSEGILMGLCQGKETCEVDPTNSIYSVIGGDPCPSTVKYIEVDYHCVEGSPHIM